MIIADIGINHNGNLNTALELIDVCKDIGVDVVKFQKRNPDICIPENQKQIIKNSIFGKMPYIEYKKLLEFNEAEYKIIDNYCREKNIIWTASIWDIDSLNFMRNFTVPFLKIPSACLTNTKLLNSINEPVIISTGMSYQEDIDTAIKILQNNIIGILHCVSSYPTKIEDSDISYINTLQNLYPSFLIGYSGHEIGYLQTIMARTLGAEIIERHITLDNNMPGTDHCASLNPTEFKNMIQTIKQVDISLGKNYKRFHNDEIQIAKKLICK